MRITLPRPHRRGGYMLWDLSNSGASDRSKPGGLCRIIGPAQARRDEIRSQKRLHKFLESSIFLWTRRKSGEEDSFGRGVAPLSSPGASVLELSIIMPCLNEAETLEVCIRKSQDFLQDHQ